MAWGVVPESRGSAKAGQLPSRPGFVDVRVVRAAANRLPSPRGPEAIRLTKFSPLLYIQYVLKIQICQT